MGFSKCRLNRGWTLKISLGWKVGSRKLRLDGGPDYNVLVVLVINVFNRGPPRNSPEKQSYTTFTNFSTKYLVMSKVYIDPGGIK